ncbi:MAG: MFS transporter [Acidimicrobiia bacterium]|nr:MFS transporter [Acidimicrobiia bacterium]
MATTASAIRRTYLALTLVQTLAASLIFGINTLFLLDAGLSNTGAFVANAAFTAGMVVFEIPTGVVADVVGRRASYLWGTVTLGVTTALYLWLWAINGPLWAWIIVSALLGLGFTFFSGATEAWLVDALGATGGEDQLEEVFGKAAVVGGAAMLIGSVGGGALAQLGFAVPYLLRSVLLLVTFVLAWVAMHDIGFQPVRSGGLRTEVARIARASIDQGLRNRPVRLIMLSAPFSFGVGLWAFYAFQPHLLDLYGDPNATWIAGTAAAVFAGARMVGGLVATRASGWFSARSTALTLSVVVQTVALVIVGVTSSFWVALTALVITSITMAAAMPIRQTLLNSLIASEQRATVLSFDGLMGSAGGVVIQPALGRAADAFSYGTAYVIGGAVYALSVPFLAALRAMNLDVDKTKVADTS